MYNSYFRAKIQLRKKAIQLIDGPINLLELFAADGTLWKSNELYFDSKFSIDKDKKFKDYCDHIGDNIHWLKTQSNLNKFNIVDVDAFGFPFEQIELICKKSEKPKIIIYTLIFNNLANFDKIKPFKLNKEFDSLTYPDNPFFIDNFFSKFSKTRKFIKIQDKMFKEYGFFVFNP